MRAPRVFYSGSLSIGARVELDDRATHHLAHVLRVEAGDSLMLFDGTRGEFGARVLSVDRKRIQVEIQEFTDICRESPLATTLIQGVSRGERMDYTIQKSVELGVSRIAPVLTERSVVKLDAERRARRMQHWQGVVIAASEQSGRTSIAEVEPMTAFGERIGRESASMKLLLHPEAAIGIARLDPPTDTVALLVGPEGGLSDAEVAYAAECGFVPVSLGPRIMRTETAGIIALAALQMTWGDLG